MPSSWYLTTMREQAHPHAELIIPFLPRPSPHDVTCLRYPQEKISQQVSIPPQTAQAIY